MSEVGIFQDPVAAEVRLPAQEDVEGALDGNFEYEPRFMLATWDDARDSLAVERSRLAAAAKAYAREAFEEILDGDPTDVDDVEELAPLRGLDVGVAAVVLALNAAGCITSTSCRGHPGRSVYVYPRVHFHADTAHATLVREAAVASDCGFAGVAPMEVWARSVPAMLNLAVALIARADTFDALPRHGLVPREDDDFD